MLTTRSSTTPSSKVSNISNSPEDGKLIFSRIWTVLVSKSPITSPGSLNIFLKLSPTFKISSKMDTPTNQMAPSTLTSRSIGKNTNTEN